MSTLRNVLKESTTAKFVVDTARFLKAVGIYNSTGITPEYGYHSGRHLYFATNKKAYSLYAGLENFRHRSIKLNIENPIGVLGDMRQDGVNQVLNNLYEQGYHKFDVRLAPELCDSLVEFARATPSKPRVAGYENNRVPYDRNNLVANLYDLDAQVLLENPIIQNLITDESLLAAAQAFIGPSVRLHNVAMWWSNADFHNVSKDGAAQLYHVDMDTIRWVNFFFYLTDVDTNNGPHCYVARSHRESPKEVYRDGRISDEDVAKYFKPEDAVELTGQKGTILAVDTTGLHKGKPLVKGERLLMQIRFAVNYFGSGAPSKIYINDKFSPEFLGKINKNASIYKDGYF
jgi:hypothetical protein